MRIVAGKHKGRILFAPKDTLVRPTSERTRESIFNIIQWEVPNSLFLDLFAGTGAMGLEAISRGANAVFNDIDKGSIELIKKNLDLLSERAEVLNCDYRIALARLFGKQFDFIFLDPPYALDITELFAIIKENKLLKQGGSIIYEHIVGKEYAHCGYILRDSRKYGKAVVDSLEEE